MDIIQLVEQLKPVFEKVADKIGTGAGFGWEVVLRQQFVYGIMCLIMAVICCFILYFGIKVMVYSIKRCQKDKSISSPFEISVVVGGLVSMASIIAILSLIPNAILRLYNPAFYALEFLLKIVK